MSSSTEPQSHPHENFNGDGYSSIEEAAAIKALAGKPVEDLKCPSCGSNRLFKDGLRKLADGSKIQRYLCRDCGYRFSNLRRMGLHHERQILNSSDDPIGVRDEGPSRAGFGSETGGGLVMESPLEMEKPAGDVARKFGLWLLKNGRKETTVEKQVRVLKSLLKNTDVYNPEAVKDYIAKLNVSEGSKINYVDVYNNFLKFIGVSWEKPKYKALEKIPFIPTEEELDMLIARCGKKTATILQLLKETGARIGEALALKWTDVDFERRLISITPEKRSKPRLLPISEKLVEMLKNLPMRDERIFPVSLHNVEVNFEQQRNSLALKLKNPRLKKITLHTFRHWKATMEYHKTKDIIYVKELLGHKFIQNTMVYITIENALFQYKNDEFYCKTAKTLEEASRLIEAGFDYVTTFNGIMLFRKRK